MVKNKICAIINLTEDSSSLHPLTHNRPIAALPFAGRYRIIDFMLSDISYSGIESVGLFIGGSGRSIYDHIRSGSSWHLESIIRGGIFTFSHQDWKRELRLDDGNEEFYDNHKIFIERSRAQCVFVSGSKIIANVDIRSIHNQHLANEKDITVVYKHFPEGDLSAQAKLSYGVVLDDDKNILRFSDQSLDNEPECNNVSLNMYLISKEAMKKMIDRAIEEEVYLELNELIQHYIDDFSVNGYEYTGYAANIDTVEKYYAANMDMLNYSNYSSLFNTSIPILTKPKHGTPAFYTEDSDVRSSFVGTDSYIGGKVVNSILNRRVDIKEGASVANSILLQGTKVGENAQIEYAIIDKNTVIDAGAKIIGSPDNIKVIAKGSHITAE